MRPVSQLVLEGAIARRHAHRMARELAGVAENPVGALEELTGGKMLLLLLGVGVIGGGIYYLATRPAAAATPVAPVVPGVPGTVISPGPVSPSSTTAPPPPNAPIMATGQPVIRPTAPNTFAATIIKPPAGPNLTVAPYSGMTQVLIAPGGYMTLTLPPGAQWVSIGVANGQVDLQGDMQSPVSIPLSTMILLGATTIVAAWTDANGASQNSLFAPSAEKKPLTL